MMGVTALPGETARRFPDRQRLSMLTATITLAYMLTNFIELPANELGWQLPGLYLRLRLTEPLIVGGIITGLVTSGASWLFQDHPALQGRTSAPYWLLPVLTALVIGIPLNQVPPSLIWWLGLGLGMAVLTLVLVGEYVSISAGDVSQPLAAAWLSAVSFALYLILASSLRASGTRLFFLLPVLTIAAALVSLRVLHLRMHGEWLVYEAGIIAFITAQLAAGFYYWALSPVSYGLLVLGPTYALNNLMINLIDERPLRQALTEPLIALLLALLVAFWLR